ncbi:crotonase/enoyl-CoA hydratase family protein [Williamsia sp. CHRR-6]|uniref:crotonase/enoyl-CoA hydratase family protein n=1 Tax=Williamsia sp. CHRR-6 TaxID=2835871 RepID=UPI001BD942D9|nr:crotonase/enoyl-CoA hydratase family protein [Williamsia sp. CHRR-6]MBT0567354.1 crotonase/enoyl-CoA hydratase family protein [Williamsia sp. CHRR-6]
MDLQNLETVTYEITDGIALVTLNRPHHLNAFTPQMAEDLVFVFGAASTDPDVAAVVVTGSGRGFCAGMELRTEGNVFGLDESVQPTLADMQERFTDPDIVHGARDTGGRVALAIYECPKPVIAAINGPAVGFGATMTLPMDFRLASQSARIGFVFGRLGVVLEAASSWFLPRVVGLQNALELVYTADIIDAARAQEIGLVRSVHPDDEVLDAAIALAHRVTDGKSQVATALMRHMLYRNSAFASPVDAHRVDSLAMYYTSFQDGQEGVAAFLDKRPPNFTSRVPQDLPAFLADTDTIR